MSEHCKEISIYVFPEKELRGLCLNFYIHVSVSDLYIHTNGPSISLLQKKKMQTNHGDI
jgi:hypothetical protein